MSQQTNGAKCGWLCGYGPIRSVGSAPQLRCTRMYGKLVPEGLA